MENIDFEAYISSDDIMYGQVAPYTNCNRYDFVLFDISCFDGNIDVVNCNFLSQAAQVNPYYQPVTLLWIRESVKKNINIQGCSFKNNNCWTEFDDTVENRGSGAGHEGYMAGGALWISWQSANAHTESLRIVDCIFENSTSDETIDIWGQYSQVTDRSQRPVVDNILIDDCSFLIHQHQTDNVLSFYNLKDSNIVISDTSFIAEEPAKVMSKNYDLMNCSLTLERCTFENNSGVSQIWSDSKGRVNNYFISFSGDGTDDIPNVEDAFTDNTFSVKDCTFKCANNTYVRTPIILNRAKATIRGCEFNNLSTETGMGQFEYPCYYVFRDNTINGSNKKLFNLVGKNTPVHRIVLYNNKFNNCYNMVIHGTIAPQIYSVGNTYTLYNNNATIVSGDLDYNSYIFGKIQGSSTIIGSSNDTMLPSNYTYNLFSSTTTQSLFDTITTTIDINSLL